jgi:acyl-CoA synthetase (AMP-forming)/AMP-acid ligase II/acyl carrier protein
LKENSKISGPVSELSIDIAPEMLVEEQTIALAIEQQALRDPMALALLAPGRVPMTYAGLWENTKKAVHQLNQLGLGRGGTVAVILPNGPEMAAAFLAVASCSTCAPLNPSYRASEFEFYLTDLEVQAAIVQSGADSPALSVAQKSGIPIVELQPAVEAPAGSFQLVAIPCGVPRVDGLAHSPDVALVLHTSGTTARPKIVPLTQINLYCSARQVRDTLALNRRDRCLNVMPLFHIHGLIAALLASLVSGGSVVCTAGFNAPVFFDWLESFAPTWYTAVPTMHQAILARAKSYPETFRKRGLRFIRSCSAALPPGVMLDLEKLFQAPVIEAYGMTEASHQMASNPLPPLPRKPGSVGPAAGPEVAIMNERGYLLAPCEKGEVVIRGACITLGYQNNPEANQKSFTDGWFRTGDQGYLDPDGYLFLTGRIKELINRGGEKIAPREIDEALLEHPAVAQAVAFATPDDRLGEEVAAAVVLKEDALVTEREIQEYAASRLADFKVPRRVVIVQEIPKGPTGKLQRIGLAEKLGLSRTPENGSRAEYIPPQSAFEQQVVALWAQVLKVEKVGMHDSFLQLGGDSIMATSLASRVREEMGLEMPLVSFFESPTPAGMCRNLIRLQTQVKNGELALQLEEVSHLSDEEAKLILDRELGQKEPQTAGAFQRERGGSND